MMRMVDGLRRKAAQSGVLRRLVLTVLVCLSLWTVAGAIGVSSGGEDGGLPAARMAASPTDAPDDADSSDAHCDAPPSFTVGVNGSAWTGQVQILYVDVPGLSRRDNARVVHRWDVSRRLAPSRRPHLHDIPLLI
jgi:hypothetical protein